MKEHENKQWRAIALKKYKYHSYNSLIFKKCNKSWMNDAEIITAGLFKTVSSHKKYKFFKYSLSQILLHKLD
jgi:hypothetical protein